MGLFDTIFGQGVNAAKGIIEEFHLSPEQKIAFEQKADQLAFDRDKLKSDEKVELAKIEANLEGTEAQAQAQIEVAQSSSNDWFVRRARPAFIWVMVLGILFSIVVFPIINLFSGKGLLMLVIPDPYLQVFTAVMISLGGMRTIEKLQGKA